MEGGNRKRVKATSLLLFEKSKSVHGQTTGGRGASDFNRHSSRTLSEGLAASWLSGLLQSRWRAGSFFGRRDSRSQGGRRAGLHELSIDVVLPSPCTAILDHKVRRQAVSLVKGETGVAIHVTLKTKEIRA